MGGERQGYGVVAKLLHWSIALLIIALIGWGAWTVTLTYFDPWYNRSLEWHKALGMIVLGLAIFNLVWIIYSPLPALPASIRGWQRAAARATHGVLFVMTFLIPVTGYVISTSAGQEVSVFGLIAIPALLPRGETVRDLATELHFWLAYLTAVLVAVHAAGALKHQFIEKDGLLRRMLW
ncbi:MAG: cytochrome b [Chromatiales bacterium]